MPFMPPSDVPDLTNLGRRLRHKVQLAITLSGVLPLLVLAYVVHGYVLPALGVGDPVRIFALEGLIICTMLAMIAGGYVIWDLGRTVATMADAMANQRYDALTHRTDEVGTLMQSFGKMLNTVEHQAVDTARVPGVRPADRPVKPAKGRKARVADQAARRQLE